MSGGMAVTGRYSLALTALAIFSPSTTQGPNESEKEAIARTVKAPDADHELVTIYVLADDHGVQVVTGLPKPAVVEILAGIVADLAARANHLREAE